MPAPYHWHVILHPSCDMRDYVISSLGFSPPDYQRVFTLEFWNSSSVVLPTLLLTCWKKKNTWTKENILLMFLILAYNILLQCTVYWTKCLLWGCEALETLETCRWHGFNPSLYCGHHAYAIGTMFIWQHSTLWCYKHCCVYMFQDLFHPCTLTGPSLP